MKKSRKRLSLILALVLLPVLFFTACNTGETEEETAEAPVINKSAMPVGTEQILAYFNRLMGEVKEGKPAMNRGRSQDIRDFESENEYVNALVPTLKSYMLKNEGDSSEYGEDLTDKFPMQGQTWGCKLTADDVASAACKEVEKTYEIEILLKDEKSPKPLEGVIGKAFDLPDYGAIIEEFKKAEGYIEVGEYDLNYVDCSIKCVVDRAADQILSVEYTRNVTVNTSVTGTGTLADVGTVPLRFVYTQRDNYSLNWADPKTEAE